MNAHVLSVSHVCVGNPHHPALDDVSLTVDAGHFLGIVGPNGAGKSTLLRAITGLAPRYHGNIELFGIGLRRINQRKLLKRVSFLSQMHEHSGSDLPIRVLDVVRMGLPSYALPLWHLDKSNAPVIDALNKVNLGEMSEMDYRHLSGGQKQRARIARALVAKPGLILLDEPSAGLDLTGQEQLYRLLRRLCDEEGVAVVMVEHDISAITAYVDSVACLNHRIHHHAMRGEQIPEQVWHTMYGEHTHIVAHDAKCIGCGHQDTDSP